MVLSAGGPERTRTSDLRFRKPLLYPAELRDRRETLCHLTCIRINRPAGVRSSIHSEKPTLRRPFTRFALRRALPLPRAHPRLARKGLPSVARRAKEGSGAPRGAPTFHACDAWASLAKGRSPRGAPLAALGIALRQCFSSGPRLRVPANKPGRQRAPRAGAVVPPGRVPKPPESPADEAKTRRRRASGRLRPPGTAGLFSGRASRLLHQSSVTG